MADITWSEQAQNLADCNTYEVLERLYHQQQSCYGETSSKGPSGVLREALRLRAALEYEWACADANADAAEGDDQ